MGSWDNWIIRPHVKCECTFWDNLSSGTMAVYEGRIIFQLICIQIGLTAIITPHWSRTDRSLRYQIEILGINFIWEDQRKASISGCILFKQLKELESWPKEVNYKNKQTK